ncbi:MAG: DNA adenine methylase [Bacillota bacterium]
MPLTATPLRYPGGKSKLYNYVLSIIDRNDMYNHVYIEPFAGGAGLAILLLLNNKVSRIVLNDIDPHIYWFWRCVIDMPDVICEKIDSVPVTIEEWKKQRYIYQNYNQYTPIEIGFSTLFLNRTNVSGVLTGGPIGGIDQSGRYKVDARFNKSTLIDKIQKIKNVKDKIQVFNKDARDFISEDIPLYDDKMTFVYFDPPYVNKGSILYRNFFSQKDHTELSKIISTCKCKWIVTYDKCSLIHVLYKDFNQDIITLNYSTGESKQGYEIVIYSNNIIIPGS